MHVELELGEGAHVIVGRREDGTAQLIEALAGIVAPRRGSLRVGEKSPFVSPQTRRRIGSVLAEDTLAPGRNVERAVATALRLRHDPRDAATILEGLGLVSWLGRTSAELDAAERRSIALALALSVSDPLLIAIHEPLANFAGVERSLIRDRIMELTASGACVLCTTSSLRDAFELSDMPLILQAGRLAGTAQREVAAQWMPGLPVQLRVQTPRARELAAKLASEDAVSACAWDAIKRRDELEVSGMDAEALALTVLSVARRHQFAVSGVSVSLPSIEAMQAAGSGWAKAAYDAAYTRAMASAQAHYVPPAYGAPLPVPGAAPALPTAPPLPLAPPPSGTTVERPLPPIAGGPVNDEDRK
jgi:ABC-type multidrug transport system ATPase subunit